MIELAGLQLDGTPRFDGDDDWTIAHTREGTREDLREYLNRIILETIRRAEHGRKFRKPDEHLTVSTLALHLTDTRYCSFSGSTPGPMCRMSSHDMQTWGLELMREFGLDENKAVAGTQYPYGEDTYYPSQTILDLVFKRNTLYSYDGSRRPVNISWFISESSHLPLQAL
jgi:hypothetical protein